MKNFRGIGIRFLILALVLLTAVSVLTSCRSKETDEGIKYSYSEIKYGRLENSKIDFPEFKEALAHEIESNNKYEIFYDKKGRPVYAESRNGDMSIENVCKIYYNENGRITEIQNYTSDFSYPYSRNVLEYNENGDLVKYSNCIMGYVQYYLTYEYDASPLPVKSTYYDRDDKPFFDTLYDYDESGNLIRKTMEYYSGGSETIEYQYDGSGRLTKYIVNDRTQEKYEYDESGRLTTHTHYSSGSYARFTTYKYEYNEAGQVIKKETHHSVDSLETYTAFEYSGDALIRATSNTVLSNGTEGPNSSVKEYDLNGNLIYEYGQLGIYRYQYDDRNLCTGVSIEGVCRLERKYDKKGDCTESTVYFPDGEVIESYEGYMTVACANHIYDNSYPYTVSGLGITKYNEYDQPIYYLYLSLNEDNKFERMQYTEYQYNENRCIVKKQAYDMEGNAGGYSEYSYHETTGYIKEEKHYLPGKPLAYRHVQYDETGRNTLNIGR